MSDPEVQITVLVKNAKGLHLRAAELLVKKAMEFESSLFITKDQQTIDCKSMLNVLTLGAEQGTELGLSANGPDADEALAALIQLFEQGFHELETSDLD